MFEIKKDDIVEGRRVDTNGKEKILVEEVIDNIAVGYKLDRNCQVRNDNYVRNRIIYLDLDKGYKIMSEKELKIIRSKLKIGNYIKSKLTTRGDKTELSIRTGINYKSLNDKLNYDRLKAYDLILIGKELGIDLNEFKNII